MAKRGQIASYLPWIIIGAVCLVVVLFFISYLNGYGFNLIDGIKAIMGGR